MPTLVFQGDGLPSIPLEPGDAKIIGRSADADVCVDHPSVSRAHARLHVATDGVVTIEDLGSANGVFVNGTRRRVAIVMAGDRVRLGSLEYRAGSGEASAIAALLSTSREMMAFADLQALLERVLDRLQAILLPDRSAILLIDRATGALRPRCVRPSGAYATVSEFASTTAVRQSLSARDVLVVHDARGDERLRDAVSVRRAGVRSAICVPLLGRSGPIGALYADRTAADGPFDPAQIEYAKAFAAHAAAALETAELYDDREQHFRLTLEALAKAIDARDRYTAGHSERVTEYSMTIARALSFSEPDLESLHRAGMLHDMGKVGVPDHVLLKSGPLDADERAIIESHTTIGHEMLRGLPFLRDALPAIRGHHERWDGKGYPDGLAGEGIHLHARIIAVADSFDAMTSARPYRKALPVDEAVRRLRADAGSQFDPAIVDVFLDTRCTASV